MNANEINSLVHFLADLSGFLLTGWALIWVSLTLMGLLGCWPPEYKPKKLNRLQGSTAIHDWHNAR